MWWVVETVSEGSLSLLEGQLVTRRKGVTPFCAFALLWSRGVWRRAVGLWLPLWLPPPPAPAMPVRCHATSVAFGPCQLTLKTIGTISRRVFVSNALQMRTRNVNLKFD